MGILRKEKNVAFINESCILQCFMIVLKESVWERSRKVYDE
jgi:hypothetical protein